MITIKQGESILFKQKATSKGITEDEFCPNGGLLYRGDFYINTIPNDDGKYTWARKPGDEEKRWINSLRRINPLTKDNNDDDEWDIREESGGRIQLSSLDFFDNTDICYDRRIFHRRLNRWVFGIMNEKDGIYPSFEEVSDHQKMGRFYEETPLVRINCKMELGKSSVSNKELIQSMQTNKEYLTKQIQLYDSNIIICCGYQHGENIIMKFIKENIFNDLEYVDGTDEWIYKSSQHNVIVINTYHPSYTGKNDKWFYNEFMKNFSIGLKKSNIQLQPFDYKKVTHALSDTIK